MKVSGRIGFLLAMLAVYVVLAAVDLNLFWKVVYRLFELLSKVLPVLGLVLVAMCLMNLFLRPGRVKKMVGKGSGLRGWTLAVVGGMLSAGPIYMWYILLGDLKEMGMKDSLIAAFLYARAIKVPLIPIMVFYFGWTFTVMLCLYLAVFSILDGLVVEKLTGTVMETEE